MTIKVRLPKYPAAYIKQLPEPVKLNLYDTACYLNGVDLADVVKGLEISRVGDKTYCTFEVFESLEVTTRLVKVKKAITLPHAPRYG
jgi:hypothetical protein